MRSELLAFSALGSALVLFLLIPIALCLAAGAPHLPEVVADAEALRALYLSLHAGVASSLLVGFTGTPLAYALSRSRSRLARSVEALVNVPLALPHSVAGIMVLLAYNSRAPLGSLLARAGIVVEDSYWGVVAAMAFVSAPIFVSTARAGFESVDVELENVARTLGASRLSTLLKVTLPLASRHLLAGLLLTFARAISEVGAVMVVAYYPKVAATLIVERFLGYGLEEALGLSTLLALVSLGVFAALRAVSPGGEHGGA